MAHRASDCMGQAEQDSPQPKILPLTAREPALCSAEVVSTDKRCGGGSVASGSHLQMCTSRCVHSVTVYSTCASSWCFS